MPIGLSKGRVLVETAKVSPGPTAGGNDDYLLIVHSRAQSSRCYFVREEWASRVTEKDIRK